MGVEQKLAFASFCAVGFPCQVALFRHVPTKRSHVLLPSSLCRRTVPWTLPSLAPG